jgi:sugar lactone lactonase YvrE
LSNQYLDEYTTADVSVTYIQNFDGSAVFSQIGDVKVGPDGTVYVADYGNNQVDVFTAVGSTASYATSIMSMTDSSSMAVNSAGTTLYVLESSVIGLVQIFSITGTTTKTFTPAGNFNTTTTSGVGALIRPGTMTLDSSGNVYVANFGGSNVVKYSPTGSNPVSFGSPALLKPTGIAVDSAGNVLVSQWSNPGFIQVFNPSGSGYAAGVTFGGACLDDPAGIALDGSGNLWVANQYGNQILEFKKTN